mgnify:CR=1 FL=1
MWIQNSFFRKSKKTIRDISLIPYLTSVSHSALDYSQKYLVDIPKTWTDDIKNIDFGELLASSLGPLALFYNWSHAKKKEFTEIASGTLASSFVHGDPVTSIGAIVALAHSFNKSKNTNNLREFKWAAAKGLIGVSAFAISSKIISIPIFNFLVAICIASAVRKIVGYLRVIEYIKLMKQFKPIMKKVLDRRELLTLNWFTLQKS